MNWQQEVESIFVNSLIFLDNISNLWSNNYIYIIQFMEKILQSIIKRR